MTDLGADKANNIHVGSEHICRNKLFVTFDTGRYDNCPMCDKHAMQDTDTIVETMTLDEVARYAAISIGIYSSPAFATVRDRESISVVRWLDYRNSVAKRLKIPVDKVRVTFRLRTPGDSRPGDTEGQIRIAT